MPERLTLAGVADKIGGECDFISIYYQDVIVAALRELAAWRGAGSWTDIEPLGKATDAALAALGEAGKGGLSQ